MPTAQPKKLDRLKVIQVALSRQYQPYQLGAKLQLDNLNPENQPTDCSGLTKWSYRRSANFDLPDGAQAQWEATEPVQYPLPGDLGFFMNDKGEVHHVGIYNVSEVIEARGEPYNLVIRRDKDHWESSPEFQKAGGWRRVKGL